jgi:hypothetical protein
MGEGGRSTEARRGSAGCVAHQSLPSTCQEEIGTSETALGRIKGLGVRISRQPGCQSRVQFSPSAGSRIPEILRNCCGLEALFDSTGVDPGPKFLILRLQNLFCTAISTRAPLICELLRPMTLTLMLMRLGVCVILTSLVHLHGSFAYVSYTSRGLSLALIPALSTPTRREYTVMDMGGCDGEAPTTNARNDGSHNEEDRDGDPAATAGSGFMFRPPPYTRPATTTTTGTVAGSRIPKPRIMTPSGQVKASDTPHMTCHIMRSDACECDPHHPPPSLPFLI